MLYSIYNSYIATATMKGTEMSQQQTYTTYTITWRDLDLSPSITERSNVEAVDHAQARAVFAARYGHIRYEIASVERYSDSDLRAWGRR